MGSSNQPLGKIGRPGQITAGVGFSEEMPARPADEVELGVFAGGPKAVAGRMAMTAIGIWPAMHVAMLLLCRNATDKGPQKLILDMHNKINKTLLSFVSREFSLERQARYRPRLSQRRACGGLGDPCEMDVISPTAQP